MHSDLSPFVVPLGAFAVGDRSHRFRRCRSGTYGKG